MRITEISANDPLTQQVLISMLGESPILRSHAEFYSMVGNADYKRKAPSASGGQFRAVNSDYPDNQVDPTFANPTLKILGDQVQVDRAHERRGQDIASVRASQLNNFAKALGKQFNHYFINGDTGVSALQFDGLKVQLTGGQIITPAANGIQVIAGNDNAAVKSQQEFLEQLDRLIADTDADFLLMDADMRSRISNIARSQVTVTKDEFGKPQVVYNEIPLVLAGKDKDGNKILPFTETLGTSTDCTSIYAVKFGENTDVTLATNIGVEVKDLGLVGVHYTHSVDFDTDLVILDGTKAKRLQGIRIG